MPHAYDASHHQIVIVGNTEIVHLGCRHGVYTLHYLAEGVGSISFTEPEWASAQCEGMVWLGLFFLLGNVISL